MNGQMNKYKESLKNTPKPVMPSEILNINIDLKELIVYAKSKNISPASNLFTPVKHLIRVDFPAPFSPISARISPFFNVKSTFSNAFTPGNVIQIPCIFKTTFSSISQSTLSV